MKWSQPNQSVKWTPNPLRVFGSLRAAHSGAPYLRRWAAIMTARLERYFQRGNPMKRSAIVIGVVLIAGCGGGSDGGNASFQCAFVGGSAVAGMSAGGSANVQAAVDRSLSTFATVRGVADGEVIANGNGTVSGGGNAGLFVTPPEGTTAAEVIVTTRMGTDDVETATGPTLDITSVTGTPATTYIGFDTTMAYNSIQFQFTTGGEYLIYEFCHSANLN